MAHIDYAEDICAFLDRGGWWLAEQILEGLREMYRERARRPPTSFWLRRCPESIRDFIGRPRRSWLELYLHALCRHRIVAERERVEPRPEGKPPRMEYALTPRGIYRRTRTHADAAHAAHRPVALPQPARQ